MQSPVTEREASAGAGLARACPVCAGGRARPAWTEAGMRYVRCSSCGTLFSDLDADRYAREQHNAWHDDDLADDTVAFYGDARALAHERFLRAHPPAGGGRLLDVGSGLGYFVERALAAGWDATGCDTSETWVQSARQRLGADRIRLGLLDDVVGPEERFDLITSWDVIEHVFDPVPFLRALRARLAPGGRIFIRTPNEAWVYPTYAARRRLLGEDVELGPLNHVVYFRASTIARALREAGLRPVAWPCLPPPQVDLGNRGPADSPRAALTKRVKNAHAAASRAIATATGGRIVLSSDLDVIAIAVAD